jgi:F-type H+-transporting ATPase subunit gamma
MADLKVLKNRISSVKKTQKITKAMKMVAASKLKRARIDAESSRAYSENLKKIISAHVTNNKAGDNRDLISGVKDPKKILLILVTSDRGLCGGLNSNLVKYTINIIKNLEQQNYQVTLHTIGKKGHDQVKNLFAQQIISHQVGYSSKKISYDDAHNLSNDLINDFFAAKFDICQIIYPVFKSAINQEPLQQQIIPCDIGQIINDSNVEFDYEPKKEILLEKTVIRNIEVQVFQALLECFASEQGARMSAMDNAVNNCNELVKKLNLSYNRTRQAKITTELIEIISAAESI